jgi:hypothetical protein
MLNARILGGMSKKNVDRLRRHAERQPRNAIFQAAYHLYSDGNQSAAIGILNDDKLFPHDRLPTKADRCAEFIFSKDESTEKDWIPCPEEGSVPHSGTDLLFALLIIENKLR